MDLIYPILCRELDRLGITIAYLATALNTTEESVRSKLRGESPWVLHEALSICKMLNFSDIKLLFLQLDNNS